MRQKILVTGGTGFIGSHTVVELQNAGYDAIILDDLSNSRAEVVDAIEKISGQRPLFIRMDVCDRAALDNVFNQYDVSGVIHFAAYKSVGDSVNDPLSYYRNNLLGLISLLEAMEKKGVYKLVFSSSCSVYGDSSELPVTEDSPLMPAQSPYANTKKICEEILKDVSMVSKIKTINLRYFNPIGSHDTALIGELPLGVPSNLVPYITQTAAGIRPVLTIHGNDYNTPDGTCIRDYIHVVDLARAHVMAVQRLLEDKVESSFEIFNLGTGRGNSVQEVINTFEKVSGVKLNYVVGPRRAGDVVEIYADTRRSNRVLGWKAERGLENMLETAWKWELKLGNK
jgi:UDP-glucose 4-epimerase